jgi:hypothetical protein
VTRKDSFCGYPSKTPHVSIPFRVFAFAIFEKVDGRSNGNVILSVLCRLSGVVDLEHEIEDTVWVIGASDKSASGRTDAGMLGGGWIPFTVGVTCPESTGLSDLMDIVSGVP